MDRSTARDVSRSSSTISTPPWKYHVYLSFRGSDTRRNFVDHLYSALLRKGLITFRDDEELEKGDFIVSEMVRAIETSLTAIVILSHNYASSTWCLDELQEILECKNKLGTLVIPVFYGVDPSDVRKQRGKFDETFAKHEQRYVHDKEKVEKWRYALQEVANLSGWYSGDRNESVLIEEIVSTIWKKLQSTLLDKGRSRRGKSLSYFLVEMLAKLASPEVTNFLAKHMVLDKIKQSLVTLAGKVIDMEKSTFTPKTSEIEAAEEWSNHLEDILYLLEEVIEHISLGRETVSKEKVKVILKELETITKDPDPFVHEQTRLKSGNKEKIIYFLLSYQESGRKNTSVIVIVGGDNSRNTILAGSVYSDETVKASFDLRGWVKFADELDALSLTKNILESFNADFRDGDDLQTLVAQLHECLSGRKFLLVFDGCDSFQNWEIFEKYLEAAERGSSIILTAQKADITNTADYVVFLDQDVVSVSEAPRADLNSSERDSSDLPESIHDQFTSKTLHLTFSHYPRKQPNRILEEDVIPEEMHEVGPLTSKETDSLIEGLAHPLEPQSNLAINSDDDAEAQRAADHKDASAAEILGVADDHTEALSDPDTFVTHGFDSRSPPVEANLPTNRDAAAETPRSADVPHKDANLLVHSDGASEILGVVDHNDDPMDALSDQDTFDFFSSLKTLKVSDLSQLRELPQRLGSLRIVECHFLESLATELVNKRLNLSELYMIDCGSLKDFVDENYCTSLTTLYIHKCRKLEFPLPSVTTRNFACLKHLSIGSSCDSLESFTLHLFPKLKTLCIWDCLHLKSLSISEGFQNDNLKLESLEIRDCPNLASFPAQGLPAPNLKSIRFSNCKNLTSLPNDMASLASLQFIFLDRCPELESFPAGGLPSTLNLLSIAFCDKLIPQKEWELQRLHSLSRFEIESGCMGMQSFPDKDLLPINLISLRISKLLSFTSLDYMGLQDLTSLESLEINSCRKLYSLPDEGFPSSLSFLCIKECPMLTQKLLYKAGAEWRKIARIPNIQINNNLISSSRTGGSSISGNGII